MRSTTRAHIATSLLTVFLLGTVFAPLVHEVAHAVVDETIQHYHPAGAVDGPLAHQGTEDAGISCSLCTLQGARGPFLLTEQVATRVLTSAAAEPFQERLAPSFHLLGPHRGRAPPALA